MSLLETKVTKNYYTPVRINNTFSSNYIEYESSGKSKTLSIIEYHKKEIRAYFKDNIVNNLKKSDMWKIQLTIAVQFIF